MSWLDKHMKACAGQQGKAAQGRQMRHKTATPWIIAHGATKAYCLECKRCGQTRRFEGVTELPVYLKAAKDFVAQHKKCVGTKMGEKAKKMEQYKQCKCKTSKEPTVDTDGDGETTFFECPDCGRSISGLTPNEALDMWNAAMDKIGLDISTKQ